MDPQLSSYVVPPEELNHIEECLQELMSELRPSYVMLLERSGQVIVSRSMAREKRPGILGALLAGSFASSREIARALNENDFTTLIQQGKTENLYAELVGDTWILALIYHKPTSLGMVQVYSKQIVQKLCEVLERVKVASRNTRISVFSNVMRTNDTDETIDLLFKDLAS